MLLIIFISFILVSLVGVVFHFMHKWFKKGFLLHIFSAINESTWEHTKLSFYPVLITMIVHYYIPGFNYVGFIGSAFFVILTAVLLIPLLYYPIRFIIGREIVWISISLYFVCIAISFGLEYYLVSNQIFIVNDFSAIIGILILFILYIIFTYFPPKNFLFFDPVFKKYGEFKQRFDK